MQLPRGTFRSIRKGVNFSDILAEMVSSRFTGTCTLSSAHMNGTLVFRSGMCVLAEMRDNYGDKAWAGVMEAMDFVTDLALSDFNTAQIQLALDFNKNARVTLPTVPPAGKPDHAAPVVKSPAPEPASPSYTARREQRRREPPATPPAPSAPSAAPAHQEEAGPATAPPAAASEIRAETAAISPQPVVREEVRRAPAGTVTGTEDRPVPSEKVQGSGEGSDLDMFDSMDLDDVAVKIRKDCKIILKQLQLDHLAEK